MTREEAIVVLKNEQPHCGEKALFSEEKKYEAFDLAIKALEHEPVLDKIRAAIKGMTPTYHNSDWSITDLVPISKVLDVIDKYKAESEE